MYLGIKILFIINISNSITSNCFWLCFYQNYCFIPLFPYPLSIILNMKKKEKKTEIYAFAILIFSKSSHTGSQFIFKNLNIVQIGIDKKDAQ